MFKSHESKDKTPNPLWQVESFPIEFHSQLAIFYTVLPLLKENYTSDYISFFIFRFRVKIWFCLSTTIPLMYDFRNILLFTVVYSVHLFPIELYSLAKGLCQPLSK